jgi:GNAT superfamily N-acetyltransferase
MRILAYILVIKTRPDQRKRGLARKFLQDLGDFLIEMDLSRYRSAHIVVGMSQKLRPHKFFEKLGFKTPLPGFLKVWKQMDCDMAALEVAGDAVPR